MSAASAPAYPIADAILAWYDRHARRLPWRVGPRERAAGIRPDPYRVWLSEVMLQQTTVAAVKPYFDAFVERWPTVAELAAAPEEAVMKAWAGLGYYSRARNLKAAADAVAAAGGSFPTTAAELGSLPGIGAYTAAAIAAIAFDEPAAVVDANIERVIARLFAIQTPLPAAKTEIRRLQETLTPRVRPGDYAQAMMDLGAAICTPKRPACALCPVSDPCVGRSRNEQERFPVRGEKADRATRRGVAYVAVRRDGAVLLRLRPRRGLLGGMAEVPSHGWDSRPGNVEAPPLEAEWIAAPGAVIHVFTHFRLELTVLHARMPDNSPTPEGHWWSMPEDLPGEALPSLMRKAIEAAVPGATKPIAMLPRRARA